MAQGARQLSPRSHGLAPRADVVRAGGAGVASEAWESLNLLIFHDHEDFSTLESIKVFVIMRFTLTSSNCCPWKGGEPGNAASCGPGK